MRRQVAGFTLLELISVIVILGIMASIAIPSFAYISQRTKLKSISSELYLALVRARSEAVKRNRLVSVSPTGGSWQNGWSVIADTDNDGTYDRTVVTQNAVTGVQVTAGTAGSCTTGLASVVFLTSGRTQGSAQPCFQLVAPYPSRPGVTPMYRCVSSDVTGSPYTRDSACP